MHRREFFKTITKGALASAAVGFVWPGFAESAFFDGAAFPIGTPFSDGARDTFYEDLASTPAQVRESITHLKTLSPDRLAYLAEFQHREEPVPELNLNQYLAKMQDFEASHREDIFVPAGQFDTLVA